VDIQPAYIAGQKDRLGANTAVCCKAISISQPMHIFCFRDTSEGQADNGNKYYVLMTVMGM